LLFGDCRVEVDVAVPTSAKLFGALPIFWAVVLAVHAFG
jgi:hypothetical protein